MFAAAAAGLDVESLKGVLWERLWVLVETDWLPGLCVCVCARACPPAWLCVFQCTLCVQAYRGLKKKQPKPDSTGDHVGPVESS